jgi:hypothetical protein
MSQAGLPGMADGGIRTTPPPYRHMNQAQTIAERLLRRRQPPPHLGSTQRSRLGGGCLLPTDKPHRHSRSAHPVVSGYVADQKNSSWMLSGSRKVSIAFAV